MEYTHEQLADTEAYLLKATPGEVGAQFLQLPNLLLIGEDVPHPIDVVNGSEDARVGALHLVAGALDSILAYAEEGGLGFDDIQRVLDELLQSRESSWAARIGSRSTIERDQAIFGELTMSSEGRKLLESVEANLIEDGIISDPYDEDGE